MHRHLRPAVVLTLLLALLTGLAYPAAVTGLATVLFPAQAHGSLLLRDGQVIGSALIGQAFSGPGYFHGRPSAAGAGYDATVSGGRNKGPTDRKLADTLLPAAIEAAVQQDGAVRGQVPSDLVTASASGLDPHLAPASAYLQVARVARARGLDSAQLRTLVEAHVEGRQFGLLGDPRVNILLLNLALDSLAPPARPSAAGAGH